MPVNNLILNEKPLFALKKSASVLSRLWHHLFFTVNILAIIWLLACKGASLYNPAGRPSVISLLSFTTTFAYIVNIFFVIYWLFSRRKLRALYSLIVLVLLWGMLRPLMGFNYFGDNDLSAETGDLKVMTWNVHMFDLGAWTNDETAKAKIIKLINDEDPDVLCLEEFFRDTKQNGMPYTDIIRSLGYPYVAFSKQYTMPKRRLTIHALKGAKIDVGNAIFSKFPLKNIQSYELGIPNYTMLSADAQIDSSHTVSLNVIHLTSVHFGSKEMEYISEVKEEGIDKQNTGRSKSLLKKLRYAFSQRAVLANNIDSLKRFMDNPIIICGDFNDVPSSYVYEKVKGSLSDPFAQKGIGLGRSYRNIFPTLRIDYILYDDNAFKVIGYGRRIEPLSDHFPVVANFVFKGEK